MKVNTPRQAVGACSVVVTALLVGACSSSAAKHSSAPPTVSPAVAVKHAYETFFDYRTPPTTGATLLQDGPAFASALQAAAASASTQKITVSVTQVLPGTSANVRKVIYTLSLAGKPTLKAASGYAVLENGAWKVAGTTFCGLLNLNGSNPPVCKDPKATTLPS
jgi:hypothetical protein